MKPENKKIFPLFLSLFLLLAGSAKAVCPVCVVAVGAGVGLCRWLGIDDTISGLWIGAMLAAMSLLTIYWIRKKNWRFRFYKTIIFAAYYILTIWPLLSFNIMGHPLNKLWGIDKILLGIVTGTAIFLFSVFLDGNLKNKNNGKAYFPYQKVIIPVVLLTIFSLIFYIIIKC